MKNIARYGALAVGLVGIVGVAAGGVFIYQGLAVNNEITARLQEEQVVLDADGEGAVISSAAEAERAANTIREHRQAIAPTYQDLLGGGRYDPTNPTQLTYTQALTMENSLNLAVTAYGISTIALAAGVFMVLTGLALIGTGVAVAILAQRLSRMEGPVNRALTPRPGPAGRPG